MIKKETYLELIKELLGLLNSKCDSAVLSQAYYRTLTLVENLYGKNDIRISTLTKYKTETFDREPWKAIALMGLSDLLKGILNSIHSDIENDLIFNLEKQTIGSVVADFITLAKITSEDNKDVAAVLVSAALEDSLRRFAILSGLQVDDKDMSEIINALKAQSLLKGPQATVATSYVKTRNKAFHAEFDKIEMPEVKSMIAFTEEFIIKNLS